MRRLIIFLFAVGILSCNQNPGNNKGDLSGYLMTLVPVSQSNVQFKNQVRETDQQNRFTYEYFYNGAGVGIGDINNDGLPDLYFCGNQTPDKLYLNKGNMKFEDITDRAGITFQNGWSTGVNFVDVNNDGLLDIYVCRSGPNQNSDARKNLLFINQGNDSFKEEAQSFGLDNRSYSIQSAFFDYDLDGDLDVYLLNHPDPSFKAGKLYEHIQNIKAGKFQTDVFYENVDGRFIDKSKETGLVNFGFRHGIAVSDINNDRYPDLYISSDFDEPDLLLINNGNKTFSNKINEQIRHISNFSMGNEICDINNDGLMDIFVVDMTPEDHIRSKLNMASMNPAKFFLMSDYGFHSQYMVNTLQLNMGNDRFSEQAQLMGIAKTDWSWAPLFFDMDLDGHKDLYVTNGVKRDILNNDLRLNAEQKMKELNRRLSMTELIEMVPSTTVGNYVYHNTGKLKFENVSSSWIDQNDFNSNGATYGDLDGDGDQDLVVNNMDKVASIYENHSAGGDNGFLKINLKGPGSNPFAIGSKVEIQTGSSINIYELHNARGFLSSIDHGITLGIGKEQKVSVSITWPDGSQTIKKDLEANKSYSFDYNKESRSELNNQNTVSTLLNNENSADYNLNFIHKENPFDDFETEILLPHRQSTNGPFIAKGDINGDGLEDFYVGGAKDQSGVLYVQTKDQKFDQISKSTFERDKSYEDLQAQFLDADGDGDQDLYIVSGGNEIRDNQSHYNDRLYLNDGNGNFRKSNQDIPELNISGQVVVKNDIDKDGDEDLFVGGRVVPGKYPYPAASKILINENGRFLDKTHDFVSGFENLGLITGACFSDFDKDGDDDLWIVGEWTGIWLYENTDGHFEKKDLPELEKTNGLWFSIKAFDYDGDGDEDYFAGNLGKNTKFKVGEGKSFHIFSKDFDDSGSNDIVLSNDYQGKLVPVRGRQCSSEQMPFIKEKFGSYQSFAEASINDIFGSQLEGALHYEADILHSVLIKNNGTAGFEIIKLPTQAQVAPIMDFKFLNLDNDSQYEIIAVGNHFGAEVETVRYDASYGCVINVVNGELEVIPPANTGLYTSGDSKDIESIRIGSKDYIIVANNNSGLDIFSIKISLPEG